MFYCKPCGSERNWPDTMFKSQGACEVCGKGAVCSEVPSSTLPSPAPVPAVYAQEDPDNDHRFDETGTERYQQ